MISLSQKTRGAGTQLATSLDSLPQRTKITARNANLPCLAETPLLSDPTTHGTNAAAHRRPCTQANPLMQHLWKRATSAPRGWLLRVGCPVGLTLSHYAWKKTERSNVQNCRNGLFLPSLPDGTYAFHFTPDRNESGATYTVAELGLPCLRCPVGLTLRCPMGLTLPLLPGGSYAIAARWVLRFFCCPVGLTPSLPDGSYAYTCQGNGET